MDGLWSALTAWLAKGQLGVIPEWFNGLSLLLALYLFLRSRRTDDRVLVDKVGIWLTTEYERQAPDVTAAERIEEGRFTLHARNANDVPVEVHQVAFRIRSVWAVEEKALDDTGFGVWAVEPGVDESRHFTGWFLLAPDERKVVNDGQVVNVAHHAPPRAAALYVIGGITAVSTGSWSSTTRDVGGRCGPAEGGRPGGSAGTATAASTTRPTGRPGRSRSWPAGTSRLGRR